MIDNIGLPELILFLAAMYILLWWVLPMTMASNRNRNMLGWLLGAHLTTGPIAIFLLAVLGDNKSESKQ